MSALITAAFVDVEAQPGGCKVMFWRRKQSAAIRSSADEEPRLQAAESEAPPLRNCMCCWKLECSSS
jgi:hypothetical protein